MQVGRRRPAPEFDPAPGRRRRRCRSLKWRLEIRDPDWSTPANAGIAVPRPLQSLAETARRVAMMCGMTRLADVTGLDRIGLPTWQAIRPLSRSLSVHQGKALDDDGARLGACMEAIECAHAEAWAAPVWQARFGDLPAAERLPSIDDCARRRGPIADEPLNWTQAERIGGGTLWVPNDAISLDFTTTTPHWLAVTTDGQGAGFDLATASLKGLCELVERDAFWAWERLSLIARSHDTIDPASIDFAWFQALLDRLRALGIGLRVFALPAVVPLPVVVAELIDLGPEARHRPTSLGMSGAVDPQVALRGAVLEAAQSRLTVISGARDDLDLDVDQSPPPSPGLALALGRNQPLRRFNDCFAAATPWLSAETAFTALASALASAGYADIARLTLSPSECPVKTVHMIVAGLAASDRARRGPVP